MVQFLKALVPLVLPINYQLSKTRKKMVALFISLMAPLETFIGLNIGRRFSRYMAVEPLASGVPSGSRSLALVHMGHIWVFPPDQGELEGGITYTYNMRNARGRGVWPPPNSKENPDSQKSSPIKLLILKKCSFASSFVSLLIDTYPAAAARRSGRTCRLYTVLMTVLGAWVLVNATALKEKHQVKEQKGRPNKGLSK